MRPGEGTDTWFFIMELKDRGYDNVIEVADAPEEKANELLKSNATLEDGTRWKVASTSVSSKFYRMVRIDEQGDRELDEE